jgi:ribosomal protein L34E
MRERERERERERKASNKERVKWNKKSPTIHWCESNVRAIVGIRSLPLFTGRHKNALLLCLVIYVFSGS